MGTNCSHCDVHTDIYALMQFTEIGGDHLDSIMSECQNSKSISPMMSNFQQRVTEKATPFLQEIVSRSTSLLKEAERTIYFVNSQSLFVQGNEVH